MALFNHAAIWDDEPELWPRGYYTNGHVLVDAEKMSKSKGNFLMMNETVEKYTADATRFACADAGDSLDDANFSRETADTAILTLTTEDQWITETMSSNDLRTDEERNFMDKVLINETNRLIAAATSAFESMQFREGLQKGWFELMLARNEYRSWCQDSEIPMHRDVIQKWAEAVVILICPICPHWSENMWGKLGKAGLAVRAPWPVADEQNKILTRQAEFLRSGLKKFRSQVGKAKKACDKASVLFAESYPQWKVDILLWMQQQYNNENNTFSDSFMKDLKTWAGENVADKKMLKLTMQFAAFMKSEVAEVGPIALDVQIPFDQAEVLQGSLKYLKSQLEIADLDVLKAEDTPDIPERVLEQVSPGKPFLWLR